jgi:hypothetical protein
MLIFVGGFLGAGKTTLILKAAAILRDRGWRVALIMNDQDAELVDTRQAQAHDFRTGEVAGGCFCCRFSDLMDAAEAFADYRPDFIFAEPVGSCVDLSATILQPLRAFHAGAYRLAPLSVLVDPASLEQRRRGEMDGNVEFLFSNQMAEADLLCVTKQDLYRSLPGAPFPVDFRLSGRTGAGVEEWLEEVLHTSRTVGARILDVDYTRYAEAEAALGWLNLHAELALAKPLAPSLVAGPLLDRICEALTLAKIEIAHLKVFDRTASGWVKAAVTASNGDPQPEGDLLGEPSHTHALAVNLRALADPVMLDQIVRHALAMLGGQLHIGHVGAFRPAAPVPQHRFSELA